MTLAVFVYRGGADRIRTGPQALQLLGQLEFFLVGFRSQRKPIRHRETGDGKTRERGRLAADAVGPGQLAHAHDHRRLRTANGTTPTIRYIVSVHTPEISSIRLPAPEASEARNRWPMRQAVKNNVASTTAAGTKNWIECAATSAHAAHSAIALSQAASPLRRPQIAL